MPPLAELVLARLQTVGARDHFDQLARTALHILLDIPPEVAARPQQREQVGGIGGVLVNVGHEVPSPALVPREIEAGREEVGTASSPHLAFLLHLTEAAEPIELHRREQARGRLEPV